MSIPIASEKKLLTPEDFEAVKVTHHPAISSLSLEVLKSAKHDLGERREKLRVILVENRRARVRRTVREASSKGDEAQVGRRKQVFSKALRRLNHELRRREEVEARAGPLPPALGRRPNRGRRLRRPPPRFTRKPPRQSLLAAARRRPSQRSQAERSQARAKPSRAKPGAKRSGEKRRKRKAEAHLPATLAGDGPLAHRRSEVERRAEPALT